MFCFWTRARRSRQRGATDVLLEKNIVSKILDIQKLKENDRQYVFALLDAFLKQTKLQSIM
ncbi:hypothetical protein EMIT036CA2_90003 [Chryseobacterium sp. IT-36CA2]